MCTPGLMAGDMTDNGKKIICMGTGSTLGLTAESMKDIMKMIRKMDKELISGPMVDIT